MDSRQPSAVIRKLQWGIVPGEHSLIVNVGGPARAKDGKEYKVSEIVENRDMFLEYGFFEYYVYASPDGTKKDQFFWHRYTKLPDKIEHFFPDELQEYLV